MNSNAVAKDHFAALPAGERGNADDDRISPSRNTPAPPSHCRSRAASVSDYANAFITNNGLRKPLWRQPTKSNCFM
jgi:hypothetical protein